MRSSYWYLLFGIAIGLVVSLSGWRLITGKYTFQGSLIDPPAKAADFELEDQNGLKFRLSDQSGKLVLIFFGYTNCPDVCPITLSEFLQIKGSISDDEDGIQFVFITVDPERDTPERIAAYLSKFDPTFIGLSGDRSALERVYKNYGVYQNKQDVGSAAGYLVDHTARVYLIDQKGNWRLTYPFGIETEKLVMDINHLLNEK